MQRFWVSWYAPITKVIEHDDDKGDLVERAAPAFPADVIKLGDWTSGYRMSDDAATICALLDAPSREPIDAALAEFEVRFVEPRANDWTPGDRFPPAGEIGGNVDETLIPAIELTQWRVGRVLTEADVAMLNRLLKECDDEMNERVDQFARGREQVLLELGGPELVVLVDKVDELAGKLAWQRALASVAAKQAALDAASGSKDDKGARR